MTKLRYKVARLAAGFALVNAALFLVTYLVRGNKIDLALALLWMIFGKVIVSG